MPGTNTGERDVSFSELVFRGTGLNEDSIHPSPAS